MWTTWRSYSFFGQIKPATTAVLLLTTAGISCGSSDSAPWTLNDCGFSRNTESSLNVQTSDGCVTYNFDISENGEEFFTVQSDICNRCEDVVVLRWSDWQTDVATTPVSPGALIPRRLPFIEIVDSEGTIEVPACYQPYVPKANAAEIFATEPVIYEISIQPNSITSEEQLLHLNKLFGNGPNRVTQLNYFMIERLHVNFPPVFLESENGYWTPPTSVCDELGLPTPIPFETGGETRLPRASTDDLHLSDRHLQRLYELGQ